MKFLSGAQVDIANIVLMLLSCVAAIILPFEMFLIAYAVLGPLHYLTEISWLHDRNYFTRGKYDVIVLVLVGILITVYFFNASYDLGIELPDNFNAQLTYIALFSSLLFVILKTTFSRIVGLLLLVLTSQISANFLIFFIVFLPTLVHVYIFTGLFMLYGALKSRSKWGFISVGVLALCPVILLNVYPDTAFFHATPFSQKAYNSFDLMVNASLHNLMSVPKQPDIESWHNIFFNSKTGILLARFIAFAYTYHYLNWFSKTEVIKWHKIPKMRFALIFVLWAVSIGLYANNYLLGLQWLFFLSFAHVLLEFPLNMVSIIGIGKSLPELFSKPKAAGQKAA